MGEKRRAVPGRYDRVVVAREIERVRENRGQEVKALAAALWPHLAPDAAARQWYKKMALRQSEFTLSELGRIADLLGAPAGWPFIPWEAAKQLS